MHITVDLHIHEDDAQVEPNATGTGISIRNVGGLVPVVNLFTGSTPAERRTARRMIVEALDALDRVEVPA